VRCPADARNRETIDALREAVVAKLGRVDILINAAGYTFKEPTVTVDEFRFSALMDTHLMSVLRACQSFYEQLIASGHGRIINIASLGSFLAFHQVAAYCAAKTAILSLTRSLACEWAEHGIVVNAIAPGVFPTELNRNLVMGTARGQEILIRTPMRRCFRPTRSVSSPVNASRWTGATSRRESIHRSCLCPNSVCFLSSLFARFSIPKPATMPGCDMHRSKARSSTSIDRPCRR
jgi:NAD(P)-dependent dehydrogenase (short-subunit alcohol dehydrogenase family)